MSTIEDNNLTKKSKLEQTTTTETVVNKMPREEAEMIKQANIQKQAEGKIVSEEKAKEVKENLEKKMPASEEAVETKTPQVALLKEVKLGFFEKNFGSRELITPDPKAEWVLNTFYNKGIKPTVYMETKGGKKTPTLDNNIAKAFYYITQKNLGGLTEEYLNKVLDEAKADGFKGAMGLDENNNLRYRNEKDIKGLSTMSHF